MMIMMRMMMNAKPSSPFSSFLQGSGSGSGGTTTAPTATTTMASSSSSSSSSSAWVSSKELVRGETAPKKISHIQFALLSSIDMQKVSEFQVRRRRKRGSGDGNGGGGVGGGGGL